MPTLPQTGAPHKLAEVAMARLGKENTHHIETAQELRQEWFDEKNHVGVTAGASTPDYLIKEVISEIEKMEQTAGA